ncbi:hypothetical protein [Frigoriflavimonas asaccharolytica]|uniref:Uncharacterized protein n=1 Tax=Frigoriflavimonas asaccharolytica TaxID=2735899 RepID=A0A8J8G8U9_9FLAO|nr:hypothetical protein [Frigoriflavimonas asaccharolytica]NRS92825.1 hypothetical protein [Frigoriflavimonas asaccharolytica]
MKKSLFLSLILCTFLSVNAQVSIVTSGFSQNLTKAELNFSGDRKLFATGINDKTTENYFVVSKNKSGAETDELYLEKFTKKGRNFTKSFSYKLEHPVNKSLAFIDNRASYSDVDKDGNYESISIVDAYENGPDSKLQTVYGIIQYNNEAYIVSLSGEDGFIKNTFSENFSKLPKQISDFFLNFWDGLKKE